MSSKERISEGEDFVIERVSRAFGATPEEAFKVDGRTGAVTVAGQPVTGGSSGGGKTYLQFAVLGGNGEGATTFPGALIGDVVISIISIITSNTPPAQNQDNNGNTFEQVISADGVIQQTSDSDLSDIGFIILLERA